MSSDNTNFETVLFEQTKRGARLPVLTGHVSVPVDMIPQLVEILSNLRTYEEKTRDGSTVQTVRMPLSFWNGVGRAPLAYRGQMSFYTPQPVSEALAKTAEKVATVDATPDY